MKYAKKRADFCRFFLYSAWQVSDFAGSYPGIIDGEYLMKRIG